MNSQHVQITDKVIQLINEELAYQSEIAGTSRADNEDHGLCAQLVALSYYADSARDAWVENKGNDAALNQLRKVAAVAIRALELYGCPPR